MFINANIVWNGQQYIKADFPTDECSPTLRGPSYETKVTDGNYHHKIRSWQCKSAMIFCFEIIGSEVMCHGNFKMMLRRKLWHKFLKARVEPHFKKKTNALRKNIFLCNTVPSHLVKKNNEYLKTNECLTWMGFKDIHLMKWLDYWLVFQITAF